MSGGEKGVIERQDAYIVVGEREMKLVFGYTTVRACVCDG